MAHPSNCTTVLEKVTKLNKETQGMGGFFFFLNGLPLLMDSTTNITCVDNVIAKSESDLMISDTSTPSIDCECVLKDVPDYKPPTPIKIKIQKPDKRINSADLNVSTMNISKMHLSPQNALNQKKNKNNLFLDEISFEFDAKITPIVTPIVIINGKNKIWRDSCLCEDEGWWVSDDYYSSRWQ